LKYREYVCVPAAFHLQHPVEVYSSGSCSIGAVPNPVISYHLTGQRADTIISGLLHGIRAALSEKVMKRSPLLTEDGLLILPPGDEPGVNETLGVPQMRGIMRLEGTSDTLRGVLNDLRSSGSIKTHCCLIGRSGHSQVGLDVELGEGEPQIHSGRRLVEIPVVLTSLNRNIPDILFAELRNLADRGVHPTIARLFIPMSEPMSGAEIEKASLRYHLLLPPQAVVSGDGVIEIPLENIRYLLSTTLLTAGQNAQYVLLKSKEGLSLIQYRSHHGIPEHLDAGGFLVGAVRISLGPYLALIERDCSHPKVFHLAARLLDAVRTTGIMVPRQVELYNGHHEAVDPRTLKIKMRLFPADPATAKVAARIFLGTRAEKIIRDGVGFSDATNIFNMEVCEALFDNLSPCPGERGNYARILSRNRSVEIQREMAEGEWHESAQNRVIYEVIRGKIDFGEHKGDQIQPDLRGFVDALESVGGTQDLRRVFVSHQFPLTDTLRVLKRNNVGVFVGKSIRAEKDGAEGNDLPGLPPTPNIYFDQTTYETFCDLEGRDGVKFYMVFGEDGDAHVREFQRGFWVTRGAKELQEETHTVIAMFGSHVEGTEDVLTTQIHRFLAEIQRIPDLEGHVAVCHGSGPGVMRIADDAAAELEILRIGVGIDTERIGQKPNLRPPVMVNFKNSARHLRQNILDRTSLCKIYNIGGMGTLEELLIAVTNLKLFESLPAPHLFVDPFGLGENGRHLWLSAIEQLRTSARVKQIGSYTVRLAPAWVPNFCHMVRDYGEALAVIREFVTDPVGYWDRTGIGDDGLCAAYENARKADVTIPPYIQAAVNTVRERKR